MVIENEIYRLIFWYNIGERSAAGMEFLQEEPEGQHEWSIQLLEV